MKTSLRLTTAAFGLAILNLSAATLLVSLESTNPVIPFATWATAANVIQDAVDVAKDGDTVLVGDGVYDVGGREISVLDTNQEPPQLVGIGASRVVVSNSIRLESVNGPLVTVIRGAHNPITNDVGDLVGWENIRCVYLGSNAALSGFTITNGYREYQGSEGTGGGGVFSEPSAVVRNCVLTGNEAANGGGGAYGGTLHDCLLTGNGAVKGNAGKGWPGGGAAFCTLYNCTVSGNTSCGVSSCTLYDCLLTGNSGRWDGGGARYSTLYNCVLTGNSADYGGGACESTLYNCVLTGNSAGSCGGTYGGTLYNCIVYYNTAPNGPNYSTGTNDWGTNMTPLLHYSCTSPLPTNGVGNITGPPLFMDMAAGDFRLREDSPCIDGGTNLLGLPVTVGEQLGWDEHGWFLWGWVVVGHITDPTDILGNTRLIDGNGDGKVAWDIGAYEFNSFKPPRFAVSPQLTPDGWKLNITGEPNQWTRLQRSSNVKDWEEIWSGSIGAGGVQQVTDYYAGERAMFYRVVVQ